MPRRGIDADQHHPKARRRILGPVIETLTHFAAWCGAPDIAGGNLTRGAIAAAMLLAGAVASPLHCAPMCGGFVLGQVSDRMARLPSAHFSRCSRLRTAALTPYHLGRLTTYAALGFAAGGGGLVVERFTGARAFSADRRGVAAAAGGTPVAARVRAAADPRSPRLSAWPGSGLSAVRDLYAALATAAATGSPLTGAIAMAAFGLGTIPALLAVGLAGAAAAHRYRRCIARLTPAVLVFNAALLTILGVRLLAGS